jgi:hypothetical protein
VEPWCLEREPSWPWPLTCGDGDGLPRFVERAFRDFLQCGSLAGGFARLRCGDCALDRLVPFSCKGRALCPRCGGRRMAERAAHLVDHVFPDVPVRQWVLSLPYRLRYVLAWDHDLCRAVVAVFLRAVFLLRARACDGGVEDGRGGAVAVVQRFGGALNLNVHIHALVLGGVFASRSRRPRWAPVMRSGRSMTCTRGSSCRPGSASGWSASATSVASTGHIRAARRD